MGTKKNFRFSEQNSSHHQGASSLSELQIRFGEIQLANEETLSIERLLADLSSNEWSTRVAAVRSLGSFVSYAPLQVAKALIGVLTDESAAVRTAAAQALGGFKENAPRAALILALRDTAWDVRASIIEALGKLGQDAPLETITRVLRDDEDPDVRRAAACALGKMKRLAAFPALTEALRDPDPCVRQEVVWSLGELRENTPVSSLIAVLQTALQDEDEDIRLTTLKTLSGLGEPLPVELLIAALQDEDDTVRLTALRMLGTLGEQIPLESLICALKDTNCEVQNEASRLLGRSAHQLSKSFSPSRLLQLLQDESAHIRAIAAWTLGEKKEQSAKEALHLASHDQDSLVQSAALWALQELAGVTHPENQSGDIEKKQEIITHFLDNFMEYLKDKRGYVRPEQLNTPTGRVLILTWYFQTQGQSLQESVLRELPKQAPVRRLKTALQSEDDTTQEVIKRTLHDLPNRPLTELFIASLDVQPIIQTATLEAPTRVILCSVGYSRVRETDQPVLEQILTTFAQEFHRSNQHSQTTLIPKQGGKQKLLNREDPAATEPLTANVQKLTPTRLGKGLSDFRLWYEDDPAVAAYAGALECQSIQGFC